MKPTSRTAPSWTPIGVQTFTMVTLVILFILSIWLKGGYMKSMPFLPDGDTYFHGMMANYIVQNHVTTTSVPYEVPLTPSGSPLNFHILVAQIHFFTGISVATILRWFGPVMSGFIGLAVFVLVQRLTKRRAAAIVAFATLLFVPLFTSRLSAAFPENVLVFYIPMLLFFLQDGVDHRQAGSLLTALIIVISAIGYHFSSYLLLPILGVGVLLYYVGHHWRYRNIVYLLLFLVALLGLISLIYSNWWLFGFITSLFKTYSGPAFSTGSVLRSYTLPAPPSAQWFDQLGRLTIILAILGFPRLLFARQTTWRSKTLVLFYTFVVLLPLQILPYFKLFSYTPFRAFVYITIPFAVMSGYAVSWLLNIRSKQVQILCLSALLLLLVPNYNIPAKAGPGDQNMTLGEFHGVQWLQQHVTQDTVTVTAPANGRQVAFYTKAPTSYDTAQPVFDAQGSQKAIAAIQELGDFQTAYIYISKYKLGPVYNFGEIREYAFVRADLTKFEDPKYFHVAFEDEDSIIYQTNSPV